MAAISDRIVVPNGSAAPFERLEIVGDFDALLSLRAVWEDLGGRSREYYFSRSFSAARAAWQTTAARRGREFLCVVGWRQGRLALIWPFVAFQKDGWLRVAQPLSIDAPEYGTVLVEDAPDAGALVKVALDAVRRYAGCSVVKLEHVRTESAINDAAARSGWIVRDAKTYVSWTSWDGIADWETYAKQGDVKHRRRRRRNLEKLGEVGFEVLRGGEKAAAAIDWLLEHKKRWIAHRGVRDDWVGKPEYRAYLMSIFSDPDRHGGPVISTLSVGGRIAAADLSFVDRYRAEGWVSTYDLDYANYGVGQLLMEECAKWAFERGIALDQRTGDWKYKAGWSNRSDYVHSFYWTRSPVAAVYLAARTAVRNLLEKMH